MFCYLNGILNNSESGTEKVVRVTGGSTDCGAIETTLIENLFTCFSKLVLN